MTRGTVLVDTNVFTADLRPRSGLTQIYAKYLIGRRVAVSQQTVAEARYGALAAGWGEKRLRLLQQLIDRSVVIPIDDETMWTYARVRDECHRRGHPLHQKHHAGDLWIAATALRWRMPLVAHDGIFERVRGIDLRTARN